jgi:hypothetical protein
VDVTFGVEAGIAPPPIRMNHAAWGNRIQYETVQTFGRSTWNQAQADSPNALAIFLNRASNSLRSRG